MANAYHYQNTFDDSMAQEFQTILSVNKFTPLDISNLKLWLDAADESTILATAGNVYQWNDKSGNGTHVMQATESKRPTTNVNQINGLNTTTWDGAQERRLDFATTQTSAEITVFVVHKTPTNKQMVFLATSSQSQRLQTAGAQYGRRWGGNIEQNYGTRSGNPELLSVSYSAANDNIKYAINGGSITTIENNTQGNKQYNRIGTNTWNGASTSDVAEILVYDRILTTEERLKIEAYLSEKWGI